MDLKLINKIPKVNYGGIEVDSEIIWNGWEPGNKYTKKLILKNVKYVTQKLNFSVPAMDVFTTTFPKTITLSAGTSFCLPITFKPHKLDVFEDKIDFQTSDGANFTVPVKAFLPTFSVDIPKNASCGIVAVHDVASTTILATNKSELNTAFEWCVADPYSVEPKKGVLKPFESMTFTIYFKPKEVSTFSMNIPFRYGDNFTHQENILVTSVAKYPSILVMVDNMHMTEIMNEDGQIVIDFGVISVGSTFQKSLEIHNASEVNASVDISRSDQTNPIDWVFSCSVKSNPVPARSCLNITLKYQPKLILTDYIENFTIKVSNKCATYKVKCIGKSDGPSVSVSQTSINFFQLNIGEQASQPLVLTNNSQLSIVPFQFIIDSKTSVFHIDKCSGIIKPKDKIQIVVTFRPQNPIQYYRRLVCLIPDLDPIFIDLIGTCHDMNHRPHILELRHVRNFQKRQIDGLSYFSPEALMSNEAKSLLKFDENDQLTITNDSIRSTCEVVPLLSNWKEYFFSNNETDVVFNTPYIGQSEHSVFFDGLEYISDYQIQEQLLKGTLDSDNLKNINEKEIKFSIKNNTKGMICIQWTDIPNDSKNQIFSIIPMRTDISSYETVVFTLKFKPDGPDRFYGSELEAFAYFKSQRQFELMNEKFISPPFCLLLRCIGHSFAGNNQPFQPRFKFDRDQVVFPSVNLHETAFRCLSFTNTGDQPLIYNLQNLNESFSVKPAMGEILPGMHQIFVIRFEPTTINKYLSSISIKLNIRNDFIMNIPVLGSCDNAIVSLDNNSQMFFSPTNVGNLSSQKYSIKNTSRTLLKFEWKIRPNDTFTVRVYPRSGRLLPNEMQSQKWFFSPKVCGKITIKALLVVQGISLFGSLSEQQIFPLRIIGHGEETTLDVSDLNNLEFFPLVVGSSAYQTFDLTNSNDATVHYQLTVTKDEAYYQNQQNCLEDNFEIDDCINLQDSKGILPGRCKKTIHVSVSPRQRRNYKLKIGYQLIDNDDSEVEAINGNKSSTLIKENENKNSKIVNNRICRSVDKLVTVFFSGVFPTLQITDVQGSGPIQWLSKLNLWKNLSLDNFNVCLDSDPTTSELIFTMATRASFHRNIPVTTRALIEMNLGAAPRDSESTEIRLMFENCGSVETKFAFLFPEDMEIELEYWAETGEYTEEELHQMKIQDNNLFDIQPRRAIVKQKDSVTVCITYNHSVVGTDRFPVLLKLDHGREILINITAVTLDIERGYIHFPSDKHVFNPTPIGMLKTPIQYYEMYNSGAVPVHFELDLSALKQLEIENYNIPILQCLNSVGDIFPGQTTRLEWIFTPIEPKTYVVDIPFHINDKDVAKIRFTAIGYDQRYLGESYNLGQVLPGESGVPSVQSIIIPNQIAKLNIERLSIGTVPTFAILRRVVFLNNISENKNITFSWNLAILEDADYVYIYPQNGRLMANESITCHLTLQTRNVPKFFDINLICEIYDESKILEFRYDLNKWEESERRRKEEFTISDISQKGYNLKNCSSSHSSNESRKSSHISYLPPVVKTSKSVTQLTNKLPKATFSSDKLSEMKNENVSFPKPFFLHLAITGRSCHIDEFQKAYPNTIRKFVIDKQSMTELANSMPMLQNKVVTEFPIESCAKEFNFLESVLSDIVGSILQDDDFLEAAKNMRNEATPFYAQLPEARGCFKIKPDSMDNTANSDVSIDSKRSENITTINVICESSKADHQIVSEQSPREMHHFFENEKKLIEDETILESLSFGNMVESLMENIIVNIISEANAKEVDLTSRPRLIALPPRSARNSNLG